jgi:heat shock protein HslJ
MTRSTRLLLLAVLASLALAACTPVVRIARTTSLAGTAWRVVTIDGRPPVVGSEPTATFTAAKVEGSGGCNTYGGSYAYDASTGLLTFGTLAMTKMACDPARGQVEAAFSRAIAAATSASMDTEGRLVLAGPGGEIVLAVDAVPG